MKPQWDDLETILVLVQSGSLGRAADKLGVSYTTVARRVSRAEAALGVTLFERLADGYHPTDEARLIAEHAGRMQGAEDDMLRKLAGRDQTLTGRLTVTAPQLTIAQGVAPAIARFCEAHPQVDLHVRATNDLLDLTRREADLAVRVSNSPGDNLKGLRLTGQQTASFASAEWAERIAGDPDGPVDWIIYTPLGKLPAGVIERSPGSRVRYRFDDMVAILGATVAGLGVARLPMYLGRTAPGLVQVPLLDPAAYADIWLVGHPDLWASAKATAFRDILRSHYRATRALYVA